MNNKETKRELMEDESVPKALIKLGIPTMVGMMTSALYNLVDTYFVGTLGTTQVAAVSVAFPISLLFLAIGLLFGSGASSYLARHLGNKEYDECNKCFSTTIILSVAAAVIFAVLMFIMLNPLLSFLGATEKVLPYARSYSIIFIIGLIFNVFNIAVNNMIISEGASRISMISMLAGGLTNVVLDPVFILVFHKGVAGAAMATLISRILTLGIYLVYMMRGTSNFRFSFRNFKWDKKLLSEIFKIGIPMLLYQLLCSLAISLTNYKAKIYGESVVAGIGVANRILSLGSMMLTGFLKGYQPFVGYNFGAKKYDRARKATHLALKWSTAFCIIVCVGLIIFGKQFIGFFTKTDTEMINIGSRYLFLNAISFVGFGVAMVYDFMFLALGRAKEGGILSISRQGIFFIPLICILPTIMGLNGVLCAQLVSDLLTFVLVFKLIYHKNYLK